MVILDKAAELFRRFMGRGQRQLSTPPPAKAVAMVSVPEATEVKTKKRSRAEIAKGRRESRGCHGHPKFPEGYWDGRPLTPAEMREKYPNEQRIHRDKMVVLRAEKKAQRAAATAAMVAIVANTPALPAGGVA